MTDEYEREDWSVRDDALRLFRETEMTQEQVAEHLGIDPDTVKEWIRKNGRLRQIHMPQNKSNLKARRMRVLELAAQNHDRRYIAKVLGISDRTNIKRLLDRALETMAEELRDQRAWERARAMHLAKIMALVEDWIPKGTGENADPKFADLALKGLAQIAQVSGYNTINIHQTGDGQTNPLNAPDDEVQRALESLHILSTRVSPGVIDGEVTGTTAQPGGDLPGENGLPA